MIYYLDASALVKAYCYEKGTEAIIRILKSGSSLYSSVVIYPEVLFALRRKMENKEIDQIGFSKQTKQFKSHFQKLVNCVQVNEYILDILDNRIIQHSMRALEINLNDARELGTLNELLMEAGFDLSENPIGGIL